MRSLLLYTVLMPSTHRKNCRPCTEHPQSDAASCGYSRRARSRVSRPPRAAPSRSHPWCTSGDAATVVALTTRALVPSLHCLAAAACSCMCGVVLIIMSRSRRPRPLLRRVARDRGRVLRAQESIISTAHQLAAPLLRLSLLSAHAEQSGCEASHGAARPATRR